MLSRSSASDIVNPGFSSTPGVRIPMGSGLIFDDVYNALAPHNRSVAGGRVVGIGIKGLLLGGGE